VTGKITLITAPDFYENSNTSILFVNISDTEQENISRWLGNKKLDIDLNLYVYNDEINVSWLLYALNVCKLKYINIDNTGTISKALTGYILTKNNVYYKTQDINLKEIFKYINNNAVDEVDQFLERILGDQNG
jgi:hypothetical protein